MEEKELSFDISGIVHALVRRIWLIILAVVVCASAMFVYSSLFMKKMYTSTMRLYVVNTVDYASTVSANDIVAAQNLASSYILFLTSNTTLSNVSKAVNNKYTVGQLKGMVRVSKVSDTEVLQIAVTGESANDVKKLADLVAQEGEKEITRIVKAGKVSVVDYAGNAYLSAPNVKKYTVYGALVGLVLSCGIIIIIELLDKRIKQTHQLTDLFSYDVLGVIPSMIGGNHDEKA